MDHNLQMFQEETPNLWRLMIFETNADASCFPEFQRNTEECPFRSSEHLGWVDF